MVGSTTVDFGSFPGTSAITTVAVTGQASITAGSSVEAYLVPTATSDHSADEHIVDGPVTVFAGNIVAGTGFTIYVSPSTGAIYGQWTIAWVFV